MIYVLLGMAFILGAFIGSWLNVCIGRIPYERSIIWPSSRCDACFTPIRWYDNLPLVSYFFLRGRCRACSAPFSSRHFWMELFTGCCFALFFYLDLILNVQQHSELAGRSDFVFRFGMIPFKFWALWVCHIVLLCLLIVTSFVDIDHMEIPLSVTLTGIVFGLILSTIFPYPWPAEVIEIPPKPRIPLAAPRLPIGLQLWPVWYPIPEWIGAGTWKMGLINSIAGILAALILLRMIRFLFKVGRGVEGLGIGDADLMMMVGAFIGWQGVVIAFFVSVLPALIIGLFQLIVAGRQAMAFGPCLALGSLITMFGWHWLPGELAFVFFDAGLLGVLAAAGCVFMIVISTILRLTGPPVDPTTSGD